jgi:hypothetical protein
MISPGHFLRLDRLLHLWSYPVLQTQLPTTPLPETFETLFLIGLLNIVKMVSGKVHKNSSFVNIFV